MKTNGKEVKKEKHAVTSRVCLDKQTVEITRKRIGKER